MSRLISVGNFYNAHAPFATLFDTCLEVNPSTFLKAGGKLSKGDVVLFGGGADISPAIYNQKASRYSGATDLLSRRDKEEIEFFVEAKSLGIPMLGICRGAQLLCALSGGSLYQHVNHHAGQDHDMTTSEGTVLNVCSVHHQMMNPAGTKHELLAWSREVLSNVHLIEKEENVPVEVEPEVVFFPETKALAIQYHPEFMQTNDPAVEYARELVSKLLLSEV